MNSLDVLSLLEFHYNLLQDYNKQKKYLCETYLNDEKNMTIIKLERNINILKNRNKAVKEKLKKTEKLLKEYNYIIEDIEDKLYSGNIVDIKQLQILGEENNDIKDTISSTETKLLEYMEENELIEEKLVNMDKLLRDTIRQNHQKKLNYVKIDKELNININKEKKQIKNIELNIDDNMLTRYKNIRKNKTIALVEVKKGICTGCNMKIPKYMVEKIKKNESINYCENCGRILCKQKNIDI